MRTAFFTFLMALAAAPVAAFDGQSSPDRLDQVCLGRTFVEVQIQLVGPTDYAAPAIIVDAPCDEPETIAIASSPTAGKQRPVQPFGERR
jgi:hypothetical protein